MAIPPDVLKRRSVQVVGDIGRDRIIVRNIVVAGIVQRNIERALESRVAARIQSILRIADETVIPVERRGLILARDLAILRTVIVAKALKTDPYIKIRRRLILQLTFDQPGAPVVCVVVAGRDVLLEHRRIGR